MVKQCGYALYGDLTYIIVNFDLDEVKKAFIAKFTKPLVQNSTQSNQC